MRSPLVVPNSKWNRTKVIIEIAGVLLGFLFLLRPSTESPDLTQLAVMLIIMVFVIALFAQINWRLLSSVPLLKVDSSGVHVHYPIEIGRVHWHDVERIGIRKMLGASSFYITSPVIKDALNSKSLWSRLTLRIFVNLKMDTIYFPQGYLSLPAEDFLSAVESYRSHKEMASA